MMSNENRNIKIRKNYFIKIVSYEVFINAPVPYRCRINTDHIRHDPACEPCSRRDGPRRSLLVLERPGRSLGLREANTAVLGSSKLPCSSVTVRGDGDIRGGPCSRRVGSGDSRSSTLIVRVRP